MYKAAGATQMKNLNNVFFCKTTKCIFQIELDHNYKPNILVLRLKVEYVEPVILCVDQPYVIIPAVESMIPLLA